MSWGAWGETNDWKWVEAVGEQAGHHTARTFLSTEGVPGLPPQRGAEGVGKHPRRLGADALQVLIPGTPRNTHRWAARQSRGPATGTRRKQAGVG